MQEENKSLNKWNNKEKIILIKKKNWERSPEKKLKKVLKNKFIYLKNSKYKSIKI